MKATLLATFVALLMVGCGENTKKPGGDSSQSNQSSSETIDLNNPKTRKKIIAKAVKHPSKMNLLQSRGKKGEELLYRKNQPKPYTGWSKWMGGNGRIRNLVQRKDGKLNGLVVWFYKKNGQKEWRATYKDGQKHGLRTYWYENGQKKYEGTLKDGIGISEKEWDKDGNLTSEYP
mgnify:CR=1 FL=1